MAKYNWQQKDWPNFTYRLDEVEDTLFAFAERAGRVSGILTALPDNIKMETVLDIMLTEAIKTSEIEGEYLSRIDVLSSIRKNLGLINQNENIKDKKAEGIGMLMIDVRRTFKEPLTREKLFDWHKLIMADSKNTKIGFWRTHKELMQVISGAAGKEKVHFEAPPSTKIAKEMDQFIKWFNDTPSRGQIEIKKAPLRSAIAHLYFESIHPFEDGNGRIGRAIAEKALSQGLGRPILLSLSRTIENNKKEYYTVLEKASQTNEITAWITYFTDTILKAQIETEVQINFTLGKVKFFDRFKDKLNERQLKVIKRIFDEGPKGFEGGMNARKYMQITKTSKATATRDLQDLTDKNVFIASGGGRSVSYRLNL